MTRIYQIQYIALVLGLLLFLVGWTTLSLLLFATAFVLWRRERQRQNREIEERIRQIEDYVNRRDER